MTHTDGLMWIANHGVPSATDFSRLAGVKTSLLCSALTHVGRPNVRVAFVPLVLQQLRHHDGSSLEAANELLDEERRLLATALMDAMDDVGDQVQSIALYPSRLLGRDDLEWVLRRLANSRDGTPERHRWGKLAWLIHDPRDPTQVDEVLHAFDTWPEEESPVRRFVLLGSKEEEQMRRLRESEERMNQRRTGERDAEVPSVGGLSDLFAGADGVLNRWTAAVLRLGGHRLRTPNRTHAWKVASEDEQKPLIRLAQSVVVEATPPLPLLEWLGSTQAPHTLLAAYHAFKFLLELDEDWLTRVPESTWSIWSPLIYGFWFDESPDQSDDKLLRLAYARAPAQIHASLNRLNATPRDETPPRHLRRAEIIWNPTIGELVFTGAQSPSVPLRTRRELLSAALRHEVTSSQEYATEQVSTGRLEAALMASLAILDSGQEDLWTPIWHRIERDSPFGRELLTKYASLSDGTHPRIAANLSEVEIAQLYTWMKREFHEAHDQPEDGFVTPMMAVSELRNGLLLSLSGRGTSQSVELMESLASVDKNLEYLLAVTKDNANRDRWKPMPVEKVMMMGNRPTAVVVTALRLEYAAVRTFLADVREEVDPDTGVVVDVGVFDGWNVALIEAGAHQHVAVGRTRDAIRLFRPEVALFVGVAGTLKDALVGDVVVAESGYLFEAGKETGKGFIPRAEGALPHPRLLERARAEARKAEWLDRVGPVSAKSPPDARRAPVVYLGKVASGSKVVAGPGTSRAQLKKYYSDALAVEMEGHGFLHSASATSCPALLVRGISDSVDDKSERDDEGWQPIAASRAAAFAMHVLSKIDPGTL